MLISKNNKKEVSEILLSFQVLQQKDDIDLISQNTIAATENVKV